MHAIQSHWMSISIIGWKEGALLVSLVCNCFLVVPVFSLLLCLVPACSGLLRINPGCFVLYKRRFHKMFWLANLLKINFCYIGGWNLLQSERGFMNYKGRQVLLQSGATLMHYRVGQMLRHVGQLFCVTKWDNFYHKVGQLLQRRAVHLLRQSWIATKT